MQNETYYTVKQRQQLQTTETASIVVVVVESPKYIRIPAPGPAAAEWRSVQARQAAHCPGRCKIAA